VGYAPPGFLLFMRGGTLMAQPFDPVTLKLKGEPVTVAEQVEYDATMFKPIASLSENGTLVYLSKAVKDKQLAWYGFEDMSVAPLGPVGTYYDVHLSPDDQLAVITRMDPQTGTLDLWTIEFARGLLSRLTSDPNNDQFPVWSPDGGSVVFTSDRS